MKYQIFGLFFVFLITCEIKITSQNELETNKRQIVNMPDKSIIMPASYSQLRKGMASLKFSSPKSEGICFGIYLYSINLGF